MPIENIISICKCPNCDGVLFEPVQVGCIQKNDNGSYNSVINTVVQRCIGCSKILKPVRVTGPGQNKSIRRTINERLSEDSTVEPSVERVDLNELIGRKKTLLRVPGGLSGLSRLRGPRE